MAAIGSVDLTLWVEKERGGKKGDQQEKHYVACGIGRWVWGADVSWK